MAASVGNKGAHTSTANASSYVTTTFNALGASGRPYVIVMGMSTGAITAITCTINGKQLEAISGNLAANFMQIFVGDEGQSGEATIAITGGAPQRLYAYQWRVLGCDLTYGRDGQGANTANNSAFNINFSTPPQGTNAGGFIGVGSFRSVSATCTWTGVTEDNDQNVESTMGSSVASGLFTTTGNKSVTANATSATGAMNRGAAIRDGTPADLATVFSTTYCPAHILLRGDNARAQHVNSIYHDDYVLGETAQTSGKRYIEFLVNNSYGMGSTRVGIADDAQITLDNGTTSGNSFYGYSFAGDVWADGVDTGVDTGWGTPVNGDRVCLEVDIDAKTIRARLNGGTWSSTQNFTSGALATVRFALSMFNDDEEVAVLGDAAHWLYTPTSGYVDWAAAGGSPQSLSPSLLTDSDTLYAPTVTVGAVTLSPSLLTDSDTFYGPTVKGFNLLSPSLLTDGDTLYAPTVAPITVISPSLFTNTSTLYAPVVTVGGLTLAPPLLTDGDTFYGPTVLPGPKFLVQGTFLTDADSFYGPTITLGPAPQTLSPSLLTDADTFYGPTVTRGIVILSAPLLSDGDTFYGPTVANQYPIIRPPLLAGDDSLFAPTVVLGAAPPYYHFENPHPFLPAGINSATISGDELNGAGIEDPSWPPLFIATTFGIWTFQAATEVNSQTVDSRVAKERRIAYVPRDLSKTKAAGRRGVRVTQ